MSRYDVIIIGAGPGGIFAAYELAKKAPELKVAVFEAGNSLEKRKCPIDGKKIKSCINCKTCAIMSGFGGAGAFSDGKYKNRKRNRRAKVHRKQCRQQQKPYSTVKKHRYSPSLHHPQEAAPTTILLPVMIPR